MGGKVFSSGVNSLYTPRMAPAVYEHVKKHCISALETFFPRVKSPIEAPEKLSFGDIDILVSLEGASLHTGAPADLSVWSLIQEALGGVRSRYEGKLELVDVKNIAIPWPTDLSVDEGAAQALVEAGQSVAAMASDDHGQGPNEMKEMEGSKARYIQVDVGLCVSDQKFEWRLL